MKVLLGDYPVTRALKGGAIASPLSLEFADVKAPSSAFKRVVRELEFDVAELAIVTFLLAKAHAKPYRLLPAVIMARFQHPLLVFDSSRWTLAPDMLDGKRIGLRSYSVTTGAWVRSVLAEDYGVALDRITWVTTEEPHVAEFRDPPNVMRAAPGKDITAMLLAGELDAAIVGEVPKDARLKPVIPDPEGAAAAWRRRTGAIQINHMVVVKDSVSKDTADEIYRLLLESRKLAGDPELSPFGVEANRRNLEVAIDAVYRQKMIPHRFTVEELFQ
jgi:4,5-dihydroxyphthalate decarboxylase